MVIKNWEQIPFAIGVNNLREDGVLTDLPFSISCGTQQGLEHFENSIGNQDAISLIIECDLIIGVICDGCTSSDVNSVNDFTSNQVGANLLSKKSCSVIRELIRSSGAKSVCEKLQQIQDTLLFYLRNLTGELAESDADKELLINNFFTATIIAVAIDKDDYCVFNLGDGTAFCNKQKRDLQFLPGKYLTSYIENEESPVCGFNIIETGKTDNINSLFISSDGFGNPKLLDSKHFYDFLGPKNEITDKGFVDGLPEFRKSFLTPYIKEKDIFDQWPSDDASFIIIKRVSAIEMEEPAGTPAMSGPGDLPVILESDTGMDTIKNRNSTITGITIPISHEDKMSDDRKPELFKNKPLGQNRKKQKKSKRLSKPQKENPLASFNKKNKHKRK